MYDCDGYTKVYASIYDSSTDETMLHPIETEDEWEIIEKILNEFQKTTDNDEWDKSSNNEIVEQIENKLKYLD